MILSTADRAFLALVGVALAAFVGLGMAACAALGVLAVRAFEAITAGAVAELVAATPAVVFAAPVGAGVFLGIRSLRSQLRATRRITRHARVHGLPVTAALVSSAAESGLEGRIDLVESGEPFAFAYGLLEPRVMVSRALADAAPPAELEAVLSHERYHVAHLDPLRIVCARTLSRLFFYLPVLSGLSVRYAAAREFAADRRAVERCGHRALAGALHRVVAGPDWPELDGAAAMAAPELLEARVEQLETDREPEAPRVSRGAVVATVAAVAVLVGASVVSMLQMPDLMTMNGEMDGSGGGLWALVAAVALVGGVLVLWFRRARRSSHAALDTTGP